MIRATLFAFTLVAIPAASLAAADPHHWPQYVDSESVATIPPLGDMVAECRTDSECDELDAVALNTNQD